MEGRPRMNGGPRVEEIVGAARAGLVDADAAEAALGLDDMI